MNVDEILLARSFVNRAHVMIRILCAMSQAPEQPFLTNIPDLKNLGDLMALCQQIQETSELNGVIWQCEPCLERDENNEALASGFRVHVSSLQGEVFFIIAQADDKLSLHGKTFSVSAHKGGVNTVGKNTQEDVRSMPAHIKKALVAVVSDLAFAKSNEGHALAGAIGRWAKSGSLMFLHNEVAHHIEDALDIIETLRGVTPKSPENLSRTWQQYGMYATPDVQARFLHEDLTDIAPEVVVESLFGHPETRIVVGVIFYLPVAEDEMMQIIVTECGMTLAFGPYIFQMPDRARQSNPAPPGLTSAQRQDYLQVLRAIRPGLCGQALQVWERAMMFLST